jgi:hypothetical protein
MAGAKTSRSMKELSLDVSPRRRSFKAGNSPSHFLPAFQSQPPPPQVVFVGIGNPFPFTDTFGCSGVGDSLQYRQALKFPESPEERFRSRLPLIAI